MTMRMVSLLAFLSATGLFLSVPAADTAEKNLAFSKVGAAFLKQHCVGCHGEKTQKADLSLHHFVDDASVLKGRKLLEKAVKMVQSGEMPPKSRPRPKVEEIEAFEKSVAGVFARNSKLDPGRITVRRLNRAEYNNTIRDLVGVDFNPAEDFPADDVGHGFDNIGDVLSLSPVLLERYLAAAESIVQRSFMVEPPKPPVKHTNARYLEPAGPNVPQTRFRPITSGNLFMSTTIRMDGEYTLRTRVYAKAGKDPVKIAFFAGDKQLQTFEVKADDEKKAERLEVNFPLEPGNHRVGVTFLNPDDKKERKLELEFIELVGPKDTRPAFQRRVLAEVADKPEAERARLILTRFAGQAYRRPATKQEIDRLVQLADDVAKREGKWEAGIQLALQAVLVSPKFLFRVELDDRPNTAGPHPIDEYQLASRLSYFLWSSMPDDELLKLAGEKKLTANLDAQVRRMLKDPKANALVDNFALQWLQLRRLSQFHPDSKLFPRFNDGLKAAMLEETRLFFAEIVREDRSILDLIDADFTYLNEPLAELYGIKDTNGNPRNGKATQPAGKPIKGREFVRVNLPDRQRGGILTQASVLTVTSNPTRTSPVKRGRWVLEQILGTPPPPPPPDVPELDGKAELKGTLRQRMEQHRQNAACAGCHARMDPIGFAFENFDAIGAFRSKDGTADIDASGTLPDGQSFNGPAELKAILKNKKELMARNLAEKMLTYALGRGVEYYDNPTIDRAVASLARSDYRFSTLVTEIAKSDPFRLRRGKDQP